MVKKKNSLLEKAKAINSEYRSNTKSWFSALVITDKKTAEELIGKKCAVIAVEAQAIAVRGLQLDIPIGYSAAARDRRVAGRLQELLRCACLHYEALQQIVYILFAGELLRLVNLNET